MSTPTSIPIIVPPPVPAPPVDDRIVLPLAYTRDAAKHLCRLACRGGAHVRPCLVPLLEERDRLMAATPPTGAVSGDCMDPVKHGACSGCACDCHRHSRRTP